MGIKEHWKRYKPLPPDISGRINRLIPYFHKKGVTLVYLFGSLEKGAANDLDIALLYEGDFSVIRKELQDLLGTWRLDVVNLSIAPVLLAFEVISTGRLIYKSSPDDENSFETYVLQQYHDLKPVRDKQTEYLRENLASGA